MEYKIDVIESYKHIRRMNIRTRTVNSLSQICRMPHNKEIKTEQKKQKKKWTQQNTDNENIRASTRARMIRLIIYEFRSNQYEYIYSNM